MPESIQAGPVSMGAILVAMGPNAAVASSMLRSIAALLGGLAVLIAIVGVGIPLVSLALLRPSAGSSQPVVTAGYLAANLGISLAGGMAAGWVVTKVADRRRLAHAVGFGLVLAGFGVVEAARGPDPGQPSWYPWLLSLLAPVGLALGGLIQVRSGRRQAIGLPDAA